MALKVLQINTFYQFGSTGRIVRDLKILSEQQGIEAYAAYGPEIDNGEERILRLQSIPRRKLNILRTRLFGCHGFYNEEETRRLIKWIEEIRPDVIHLHNIHNHFVHVGRLFKYIKEHNIPVIWTLHDCWPFTGHCAYFDYSGCEKWKSGCGNCPSLRNYPPTWFFDRTDKNFRLKKDTFTGVKKLTLVTPSQWLAGLTRDSFLKEYPVEVINNGVDTNVFCPSENNVKNSLGICGKKMLLAMATMFDRRKGTEYLLQLPKLLNDDEVLVLVGLAEDQKKLFAQKRCIGIGRTNSVKELAAYYSAADIFINPTLEDNFPTTNIEALACGTPVVTFRTGGSPESVDDSVGCVVEKGDLQAMLQSARKIMSRGKDFYSTNCVEKAHKLYNKDIQYMKYIELYKNAKS